MKAPLLIVFSLLAFMAVAQQRQMFTVDGQNLELETVVKGPLTLLWNKEGRENRFFSLRDNEIIELKNSRENGIYKQEYKDVLRKQTFNTLPVENVNFNLRSLNSFFVRYNEQVEKPEKGKIESRLGLFAGADNVIFTENSGNTFHFKAGAEYEMLETSLPRHSGVIEGNYIFENSDHKYSSLQLSLNYRFKFINTERIDVFVNAKFFAFTSSEGKSETSEGAGNPPEIHSYSTSGISAPFILGLGADYRLGDGFLILRYNDIVGINIDANKEFPVNLTLGYKFVL